jgi:hypothetical protein
MALISYAAAVRHLRQEGALPIDVSPEAEHADVAAKIEQASALVLVHLKRPGEWSVDTDPEEDPEFAIVQAAVLKVLGNLYRFRGDDEKSPSPISEDVVSMLSMLRDPSLA